MAAHHLHHEAALVGRRRAHQRVDGVDDPVQRRVGPDRHVAADEVVVDAAHQAGDHQRAVRVGLLLADVTGGDQFGQQVGPLASEQVESGQRPVAADHDQPVDPPPEQVPGGAQAPGPLPEVGAAEGADEGAALVQHAADVVPAELADAAAGHVVALDHALVALEDGEHLGSGADRRADHRADRGVHALGVAARGEDPDPGPWGGLGRVSTAADRVGHATILPNPTRRRDPRPEPVPAAGQPPWRPQKPSGANSSATRSDSRPASNTRSSTV